jgi:class 3 adenylate cyclase/tetratricopeptide (TPR) repeat protein
MAPTGYVDRVLAATREADGARRRVTILFCDVKGSTAMAEALDPEDVMEIMDGAFDVLIEPIVRYEGTVARLMGDAVLAFFGAPIAHEDDPERACRAALEIVEGARAYGRRLEEERSIRDFDVRVGINTGLVVVGEVGSDLRVEYTAMGDAINLAARMEGAAAPGTVLITEQTYKLIAALFDTEALGPVEVKGKAEPVSAYQVLKAKPRPGKARGVAGLDSPLVGREAEFDALLEAVERLQAGVGGVVTIVGEAGIGKSRLVAEVRKQGARHGRMASSRRPENASHPQWVEGRCLSYGKKVAYLVWIDVLRGLLGVTPEDAPARVRDVLKETVMTLCPGSYDDVYPYLGRLMSVPLATESEAALESLGGEGLKVGTFRAVEAFIDCATAERPTVLVCEDLHWADSTSVELLRRLLPLTDRAQLLLICLFRPERDHGCWRIKEDAARLYPHRHTDLHLDPLSTAEGGTLLRNLLWSPSLSRSLQERVLGYAQGNPFYVEEIIRSLIDNEVIVQDEEAGRWYAAYDLDEIPVPDTLHGVLLARIDRLPDPARRILQAASVIGRIFRYRLLQVILAGESLPEGGDDLDAHLVTLQREEMIRERARLPELEYIFKHHLTQEAAYNGLLRSERRAIHRRVAEALERLFPDRISEQPELLAYHWERCQDVEKTIWYLFQAGERARRMGASLEAVEYYQSALANAGDRDVGELPLGRDRMHERLGDVYMENLSRLDEALDQYTAFKELATSGGDAARAARKMATVHLVRGELSLAREYYEMALASLSTSGTLSEAGRIHYGLAYLLAQKHQVEEAATHAHQGLEIARRIDDRRGLADAYRVMGIIALHQGDLRTACRHDERSLELYRQVGDLPRMVQACNNVGDSCRLLGEVDRALARLEEGLDVARRIGDTRDEALLLQTTAELFLDQGRWEEAIASLERALSVAVESGVKSRILDTHRVLGVAYQMVNRLDEARQHLTTAQQLMKETEQLQFAPRLHLDLACLCANEGRYHEARDCIRKAREAAGAGPSDAFLGPMHACLGHLGALQGEWNGAVTHLEKSLRHLERAHLLGEVAKTHLSLGRALGSREREGDRGRACKQLLAALSLFRQMKARGYVAEVDRHLERLGCRHEDAGSPPDQEAGLSSTIIDSG